MQQAGKQAAFLAGIQAPDATPCTQPKPTTAAAASRPGCPPGVQGRVRSAGGWCRCPLLQGSPRGRSPAGRCLPPAHRRRRRTLQRCRSGRWACRFSQVGQCNKVSRGRGVGYSLDALKLGVGDAHTRASPPSPVQRQGRLLRQGSRDSIAPQRQQHEQHGHGHLQGKPSMLTQRCEGPSE